jgi:response regulator RpfG family c-di-GMP phosphodiesterase
VIEIVRWHRANAPLEDAPIGAQIVSAANAYDMLVSAVDGPHTDRRAAIDELVAASGARYAPSVVRALATVVGVKPRAGRRRRRNDTEASRARGAA